jgi:hypothetical protein
MTNLITQTEKLMEWHGYSNDLHNKDKYYEIQASGSNVVLRANYWESLPEELEDRICELGYTKFTDWDDDCGPIIMYLAN